MDAFSNEDADFYQNMDDDYDDDTTQNDPNRMSYFGHRSS